MSTTATRLSQLEAVVDRLVSARGPRVSAALRLARQRAQQGEPAPTVLHDLAELEALARGRGLGADMARAALRIARGAPSDALSPPRGVGQEGQAGAEAHLDASHGGCAPTRPQDAAAGRSDTTAAVLERIDRLLATAHG